MYLESTTIFVLFIYVNGVHRFLNDTSEEDMQVTITRLPRNQVFAELSPSGSDSGNVHVYLPNVSFPRFVCYPQTFLDNSEASKLIHVLCKQLGHVTFDLKYKNLYSTGQRAVLPTSAQCTGREDDVSKCPWENVKTRKCRGVLATRCSSCNYKYLASHGAVHNPGYPQTYLYSLICEWYIQIPEGQGIELNFEEFALPRAEKDECDSYVELTYGDQKSAIHDRLCPADKVISITIPYKSVRIRFASGVFQPAYERQQAHYGLHITYTNVSLGISTSTITKISVVTGGVILFAIAAMCCYFCQYYVKGDKKNRSINNLAHSLPSNSRTEEQLPEAYDFQRCAMQVPQGDQSKRHQLGFTIFQSVNSSSDSCISSSENNLPVTSALAPIGPVHFRHSESTDSDYSSFSLPRILQEMA